MTTAPLTLEQAIIVSGYTGFLCCDFSDLHSDVEKRLGYPVWTHQFGSGAMKDKVHELYREDFIALCAVGTPKGPPASGQSGAADSGRADRG